MKTLPSLSRIFPRNVTLLLFALLLAAFGSAASGKPADKYLVYVGTYTEPQSQSKGIYAYRYDASSGKLNSLGLAAEAINPSFLAVHPNRRFLYAVNEVADHLGKSSGAISAFSIDAATGKLKLLNQVASLGADPCYITLDKSGKFVLVANYTGGSVAVFPVLPDGRLGKASAFVQHTGHGTNPERQEGPHAHSIDLSTDNRFAFVDDLGLDELLVYRFDAEKGMLTPNDPPFAKLDAGAGPRHFALRADGKFAYVVSEMQSSVTVFSYDAGAFRRLQTLSTLPKDFSARNEDAEIEVHPSGKFLYASNRGHDSIAVFSIDQAKGTLTLVEHVPAGGKEPRHFEIDPAGKRLFVENQKSDDIVVFRIDEKTGRLTKTEEKLDVGAPVCVKFVRID